MDLQFHMAGEASQSWWKAKRNKSDIENDFSVFSSDLELEYSSKKFIPPYTLVYWSVFTLLIKTYLILAIYKEV